LKKSLLAGVSLGALALATGAQAADMAPHPAYKTPAMAPAPWSWAGFYVGGNVGFARARTNVDSPAYATNNFPDNKRSGVIGGVQAGYNWQINNVVVGLEGDLSFGSLRRSTAVTTGATGDTINTSMDALGTLRGRVGLAFDRILVYGTGGVAFASLKDEYAAPAFPFTATAGSTATGWAYGGGVEYALMGHWTARAEYLHVGFPSRGATETTSGFGYTFNFKDSLDIGRVGINYKF